MQLKTFNKIPKNGILLLLNGTFYCKMPNKYKIMAKDAVLSFYNWLCMYKITAKWLFYKFMTFIILTPHEAGSWLTNSVLIGLFATGEIIKSKGHC